MFFTQQLASDILKVCNEHGANPFQGGNTNLLMYTDRGKGGGFITDHTGKRIFYPGTSGVDTMVDLMSKSITRIIRKIPNKRAIRILDPLSGSNTTFFAAQELQKKFPNLQILTYLYDLRPARVGDVHTGGFDAVKGEYDSLFDIVWIHHPYGSMYEYSKIWGGKADSRDISVIPQEEFYTEFIPRVNLINWNAFKHLSQHGELLIMTGDRKMPGKQEIYSMAYSMNVLGEIVALPMKIQVNASSNYNTYGNIMYQVLEYITISSNPDPYQVKIRRINFVEVDMRNTEEKQVPWIKLIEGEMRKRGGVASISQLYEALKTSKRALKNSYVREKIRQELRRCNYFICLSDGTREGVYGLGDLDPEYLNKMYERLEVA